MVERGTNKISNLDFYQPLHQVSVRDTVEPPKKRRGRPSGVKPSLPPRNTSVTSRGRILKASQKAKMGNTQKSKNVLIYKNDELREQLEAMQRRLDAAN